MKLKRFFLVAVLAPMFALSGCATSSGGYGGFSQVTCAAIGAVAGGVAGAVINDGATGVAGAAVGAVAGAILCGDDADGDGDGVPDSKDRCPTTPAGAPVDERGCALDSDSDGVPDYKDKCFGTPVGTRVDGTGCPVDTDRDGVPDAKDRCPGTPVGVKVDEVGCPLDSDGDGVVDYRDKCPGTPSGVKVDNKGCPKVGEKLLTLRGVNFDFDRATIRAGSDTDKLDNAVRVLQDSRSVRVKIVGHTDDRGPESYNLKLSRDRATAVMNYLISHGVSAGRLVATGEGETAPAAPNDSRADRATNRRVEFVVIK